MVSFGSIGSAQVRYRLKFELSVNQTQGVIG